MFSEKATKQNKFILFFLKWNREILRDITIHIRLICQQLPQMQMVANTILTTDLYSVLQDDW